MSDDDIIDADFVPLLPAGLPKADGTPGKQRSRKGIGGRPEKLTAELQKRVCDLVRGGNYVETAAACAGISKETLYAWLKKGAAAERGKYREFSDAVAAAAGDAESRNVLAINRAGLTDWKAGAWFLERTRPAKFGRRLLEVSGPEGGAVKVEVESGGLLEQLRKLAGEEDK